MKTTITNIFQKILIYRDIRFFKNSFFYYLIFRILRNFLKGFIIVNIYNFKIYVSTQKIKASYYILKKCDFDDKHEIETISKISKIKKIFLLDCGCNYGFYSFFTASLSKNNKVLAYEASSSIKDEFNKNLSLNNFKNINCKNLAISDTNNKIIELYESENDWESSINHSVFDKKITSKTKTTTIDFELQDYDLKEYILCIKLDIEGSEFNALKGAKNIIKKFNPIFIIEISKYNINQMNSNLDFLNNFLLENNYLIFDLYQNKVLIKEIKRRIEEVGPNHNTIGNFYLAKNNLETKELFEKNE